MGDFFSFLWALLTFQWLVERRDAKEASASQSSTLTWYTRQLTHPCRDCEYCTDRVFLDDDGTWKHALTGMVKARDRYALADHNATPDIRDLILKRGSPEYWRRAETGEFDGIPGWDPSPPPPTPRPRP